jgi:hypothetical protein
VTPDVRRARVRTVLEAARRLACPDDPLGRELRRELARTSGLSPEGIDLGLERHMETDASADEVDRLIEAVGVAPRVHVILSANVFVAAVRAVALAVAAAPEVVVRPSRREPVTARLLVCALADRPDPLEVACVSTSSARSGDHVHVYGGHTALQQIRCSLPAGTGFWGHGPGIGVAVVGEDDDLGRAAELLSWDVVAFDQRGCLSPRIVLFAGAERAALDFAEALSNRLEARQEQVPRGALDAEEIASLSLYTQAVSMIGTCIRRPAHVVGVDPGPRSLVLPPPGRHVHVACVTAEANDWLEALTPSLTTIGRLREAAVFGRIARAAPWAREARLGEMQRPAFDGPVDRRARLERV